MIEAYRGLHGGLGGDVLPEAAKQKAVGKAFGGEAPLSKRQEKWKSYLAEVLSTGKCHSQHPVAQKMREAGQLTAEEEAEWSTTRGQTDQLAFRLRWAARVNAEQFEVSKEHSESFSIIDENMGELCCCQARGSSAKALRTEHHERLASQTTDT